MSLLKEVLKEFAVLGCNPNRPAPPPNLPLVWSNNTVNTLRARADADAYRQEIESGVRNDMVPPAHEIDDYGDVRYGDAGEYGAGMDAYHDAEDDFAYGEFEEEQEDELDLDDVSPEDVDDDYGDELDDEDFVDVAIDDEDMDQEWDDPDYQGIIRTVPNAHLVYKRQQTNGTFEELWQYNIGKDFKKELEIRRAILAGTDIPQMKMRSPDGSQAYELWTAGNCQLLRVIGLPN